MVDWVVDTATGGDQRARKDVQHYDIEYPWFSNTLLVRFIVFDITRSIVRGILTGVAASVQGQTQNPAGASTHITYRY